MQSIFQWNTANILFILSGAFSGLTDVIKKRISRQRIGCQIRLPARRVGLARAAHKQQDQRPNHFRPIECLALAIQRRARPAL